MNTPICTHQNCGRSVDHPLHGPLYQGTFNTMYQTFGHTFTTVAPKPVASYQFTLGTNVFWWEGTGANEAYSILLNSLLRFGPRSCEHGPWRLTSPIA